MTPRALLTSIGATAVAFAVAIGIAAGSANSVNTSDAVAAFATVDRVRAYEWSEATSTEGERQASWNEPCLIAV